MRRARITAILLLGAGVGAVPGAAAAAVRWSVPQPVSGPSGQIGFVSALDFGTAGTGVLGWSSSTAPFTGGVARSGHVVATNGGIPASARQDLAPYDLAAPPQAYGRGRALALVTRDVGSRPSVLAGGFPQRIAVASGPVRGPLGKPRVLAASGPPVEHGADLAVNDRGDALAVWIERRGETTQARERDDRLWISVRHAGGAFGKPSVLVGSGHLDGVDAAIDADGDVAVAFAQTPIVGGREKRPSRVAVRYHRAGEPFGPAQAVGSDAGIVQLATAVAPAGRAFVAWGTQDGGEEADTPWRVYAAARSPRTKRFRAPQQLDPGLGALRPVGSVSIGLGPGAKATVAWSGTQVTRTPTGVAVANPVLSATTDAAGRFAPTRSVAGGNGAVGGIAISQTGAATVAWTAITPGPSGSTTGVMAADRPAGAMGFGPAELVSDQSPAIGDGAPAIALDPATNEPVVAWTVAGTEKLLISARTGG